MKHLRQIASTLLWLPCGALVGVWCVVIGPLLAVALLVITFTNRFGTK